jgi:16S rRNA U516 pseudouridylate synthase RsuA-like enzyme
MTRLYKRLTRPKIKPEAALKRYAGRMDVYGMGLLLMWAVQYTREWTAAPNSAVVRGYMAFVARMLHPDPVKRVSMGTAIKEATAWLGKARG